jgi:phosphate ABC transporter phosphate-binding protein
MSLIYYLRRLLRRRLAIASLVFATIAGLIALAGPASADSYVTISGSGSTWSQVAVDAWRVDVHANGLTINYNGDGSSAGRLDFIQGLSDFAVSEIPFQLHPEDGSLPEISKRPYAYLPIVAGGTSFMYHLTVGGKRVTDLRLSGATLTKIYTGVIKRWNDPAITADYGRSLPNEPIVPVIRADGSGTSAQFTRYMSKTQTGLWNAFCQKYAHPSSLPCGLYSFYPPFPGSKAQTGSNGVADYVASSYAEGAIGYVEYAYALNQGYPVVKLLNSAGYYSLPSATNVAVALTKAQINPSDLTANLDGVYVNSDPRTYPMSSYSYMIVPTDTSSPFNTAKGKTLSTFIDYFLCKGQQKAAPLGYSPLPQNLVQAGFQQVQRIPGNVGVPALSNCANPTIGNNNLVAKAPMPSPCDKVGTPLTCATGGGGGGGNGGSNTTSGRGGTGAGGAGRTTGSGGSTTGGGSASTTTGGGTGTTGTGTSTSGTGGATTTDPLTGQAVNSTSGSGSTLLANSVDVASRRSTGASAFYGLSALELLGVVLVPPVAYAFVQRRRRAERKAAS